MTVVGAPVPLREDARGRRAAGSVLALGPAALVGGAVLLGLVHLDATTDGTWPSVVALVALVAGVPHGAVDHLALAKPLHGASRAAAATAYLMLALAATALVLSAPAAGFLAVIALSVWHFGSGDVDLLVETGRLEHRRRSTHLLHILAAGAAPVLLPLASPQGATTLVLLQPRLEPLTGSGVQAAARVATLLLVLGAVVLLLLEHADGRRGAARAATELVALVVGCLLLPPLLAFALYFALWHAARHTMRLALDDRGRIVPALAARVVREGAPSVLVAAVAVASLLRAGAPAPALLWVALAVVWGLTVPHAVVVGRLGRRRRAARALSPSRAPGARRRTP